MKKRFKKKKLRNILMFLFFALFLISAWQVYKIENAYRTGLDTYSNLEQYISFDEPSDNDPEPAVPETHSLNPTDNNTVNIDNTVWPNVDFQALQLINPDIIGWLYIEGTAINYPIVQGTDNSYYLTHLFDGSYNKSGCLFLDAYSDESFAELNSVIYGHNMKNGSMFNGLVDYKQQEFYDDHSVALLITPNSKYKIHFFSGYIAKTSASAWDVDFSDVGYVQWLEDLLSKSCFSSDIVPTKNDRVITLSTCSYEFNNARFVLHGILLECN